MRRILNIAALLAFFAASCSPQPAPVAEPTSISAPELLPSPTAVQHAPEIRFALIGEAPASPINVWALFDEAGASYTNYALMSGSWPRLFRTLPSDSSLQPFAAQGMPSPVAQENELYSATVSLRTDLKWTDGSPFSAEDVAFTTNTAIAFELSYDWQRHYDPNFLLRAEALDPYTVKFHFKQKPGVAVWQYGVLQAPIVQKAYWENAIGDALGAMPSKELLGQIEDARAYLATVQSSVDELTLQFAAMQRAGQANREIQGQLARRTAELGFAKNSLDDLLAEKNALTAAAHQKLFQLDSENEPTLGPWLLDSQETDIWVSIPNPDYSGWFGAPNFDRAVYRFYPDEQSALTAFQNDQVDFVLSQTLSDAQIAGAKSTPSYSARFLVFNPLNTRLADPSLRSALNCMIDRSVLAAEILQNKAMPFEDFVLSSQWHDASLKDPCSGMDRTARIEYAVQLLKTAGYSWSVEPGSDSAGQGLLLSSGEAFAPIALLAPLEREDALRSAAARYIAGQAQYLGIPLTVQETSLDEVVYAVYSSQKYDAALMGWRLSEHPAYLCEWVGGGNPYLYNGSRFQPMCDALAFESEMDAARQIVGQVESGLMAELPLLPLFTVAQVDVYDGISYPVQNVLNGWAGFYGAPSYAIPSP
ncbi:MAG: hypothetical protein KA480_08870 [Anaerolineales bacterium]|nr:hypothetical protein [Anaerolineales bacterium]